MIHIGLLLVNLWLNHNRIDNFCQDSIQHSVLTKRQFLDDFSTFERIYRAANSGLYKYRTHQQIDSVFRANRALITTRTTLIDFYRLIYSVTDYTGSLHSDNYLPKLADSLLREEDSFFPYPVKIVGGSLLLNTKHAPFPVGSTILTINGQAAGQVLRQIGRYATTDGYNQTGKTYFVGKNFSRYYRLDYGPVSRYELTYLSPNQTDTLRINLPAVSARRYRAAFEVRYSLPLEPSLPEYAFEVMDSLSVARLTVRTFALGGTKQPSQQRYARFLDSTFQFLRSHPHIRHLIVDVRQNGGGNDPNDLLLYSYLTNRHFRENKRAFSVFRRVPFPAYFVEEAPGDRQALETELQEEHQAKAAGGRYYLNQQENPSWSPNRYSFRGKIYLLIDAQVASAGSLFASMVRSDQRAIVIGEETSGGYYGHTGHTPVEYQLPHTQIRVKFSIIDLQQDVRFVSRFPLGRGVMPDYVVSDDQASFLTNKDQVLDYTLRLIRRHY